MLDPVAQLCRKDTRFVVVFQVAVGHVEDTDRTCARSHTGGLIKIGKLELHTSSTINSDQMTRRLGENWAVDRSESAKWVSVGLVAFALLLIWLGDGETRAAARIPFFLTGIFIFPCAAAVWLLSEWRPALALPLSGVTFALLMSFGALWLQIPGLILLAGLPVAYLTLAGQGGVAATIGVASSVVLWADNSPLSPIDKAIAIAGIVALWLIAARARYSMTSRVVWAFQHYNLAQQKLEEARDRNQELDSVLEYQVHTNRQLDLLNERLAALRARAEESQRTKTNFVAKVSHEFRTPLNMIIGLVDLLTETPHIYGQQLPPQLLEDLKIVHRNCEHLSAMINDVLDLSQTEAGRLTLRRELGDLCEDIHHAVEIVRPLVEKKGIALYLQATDYPCPYVRDQTRLRQVLLNLLSNAARYTSQGMIAVRLMREERAIRIEVTDTGPGIHDVDLERIFEPFFQSSTAEGRSQKGTGLGLSISKQFMELHGGQLGVESKIGEGSTFWLSLPTAAPGEPVLKADRWIHEEWLWRERHTRVALPTQPRQQRLILLDVNDGVHPLLDEHPPDLELLSKMTVAEVAQAATETPAHAVLVNGSSAEQVVPLMQELCRLVPDTPILGWTMPSPNTQARLLGAMDYLVKPVTRSDLVQVLARVPSPVRRVLVVDDDLEVQRLIRRMLQAHAPSIEVHLATTVEGAMALLDSDSVPPDLMLLDLALQGGTGWELLTLKQQQPHLLPIPAVIISAQDPMERSLYSPLLMASMGDGLSLSALTVGTRALLELLLNGASERDPMSG